MKRLLRMLFATFVLTVAVLGVLRLTPLWDRMLSPGTLRPVDFATLELGATGNEFLLCPPDLCAKASAHAESPVFDRGVEDLRVAVEAVALNSGGVTKAGEEGGNTHFVARTPLLRWPDWVTVRVLPAGEGKSTLAIYSRAVYGRRDFGVNQARIEDWLSRL